MTITRLEVDGYRNLQTGSFTPDPGVNIIYGDNGQGKTNLLEALWLFTGGRSFRGVRDSEAVAFDRDQAKICLAFEAQSREQQATLTIGRQRRATLNGVDLPRASQLTGKLCAVVFSPAHLSLVRDGPEERRRFIDAAYCQLRPGYVGGLHRYRHTLLQRNTLLKQIRKDQQPEEALSVWDQRLAESGAQIYAARTAYVRRIQPQAQAVYDGIAKGREKLTLHYASSLTAQTLPAERYGALLLTALEHNRLRDVAAGTTTVGPHRDDLILQIDGRPARQYASQGQQRSAVLALKMAEATLLREVNGEQPLALLDDVMSELDPRRQDYILNHIHGWQVFMTCCDPSSVWRLQAGRIFHMQAGAWSCASRDKYKQEENG